MMAQFVEHIFVTPDTAGLDGHFPGNPLVPAALQIEWMVRAAECVAGSSSRSFCVSQARFLQPIRPGSRIELSLSGSPATGYRVELREGGRICAKSQLTLEGA